MPLSAGDKLGHYEVLSPLGAGGMGEVYRARDTQLDREVAIKVLPPALANNPESLARFDREAKILAALNHPNIAMIHGLVESESGRALVMELVPGTSLAARIKSGPIPREETLQIARQIAEALEAAHEKGVVHRDLKPANVMITPAGLVKVLDFGLAAMATPAQPSGDPNNSPTLTMGMTQAGAIMGTAAYMSPEQAAGAQADRRADIWAYGVVLWELHTGKRLFGGGETISHTLADVLRAPIDLEPIPAGPMRKLLKRCLDRRLKTRLQSIAEARILIDEILAGGLQEDAASASGIAPAQPVSPLGKWALRLAAATFAVALAGLAALALLRFREEPPRLVKLQFLPPEKGSFTQEFGPPAVSPDGRRVAFTAIVGGKSMLWVRELDSLLTRALAGTENGYRPFWAPDSRNLGFAAEGKLMKIDVTGGPAITITSAAIPPGANWSLDDVIVFAPNLSSVLMRISAAGGTPAPVTALDESRKEISHRDPWFLPGGRRFLYSARSNNAEQTAIFAGDLESAKFKKLVLQAASNVQYVEPRRGNGYLLFVRERTLMAQPFDAGSLTTTGDARPIAEQVDGSQVRMFGYFSTSLNGVLAYSSGGSSGAFQIRWQDRAGKVLGTVGKPADIQNPRLSPDGKTVATERLDAPSGNRDIWLHDLVRATEQRLTFSGNNQWPVWSPDGLRVAFIRTPDAKVMVRAANGTGVEEILEASTKSPMDWTRDGRFLVSATWNSNPKTGSDIWAMPLSGGDRKPLALRQTEFSEWHARVSPDGRWMACSSNESKRNEVYVVGFPALNGKWQISANGGTHPVWSRNGRELYFVGADGKLMAVPITGGPQFQPGVPQPLFDVRLPAVNNSYDVSADGRFLIAMPAEQSATVPMTVVLNWYQGLSK